MAVTILELTREIQRRGFTLEVTRDSRATLAGGPMSITIYRNNRPFTNLALRTLNPIDRRRDDIDSYFITDITIDESSSLRTHAATSSEELWNQIHAIRVQTLPATIAYPDQQHQRFDNQHQRQPHRRYIQREGKHQRLLRISQSKK